MPTPRTAFTFVLGMGVTMTATSLLYRGGEGLFAALLVILIASARLARCHP